ncbi:MAG: 2-hydroxyacid dehydrogenase [Alphaproteobacteria bacterium]|nr:2-hydroxyacid dehydrogenase [Alphaproteobacteria bacterium]
MTKPVVLHAGPIVEPCAPRYRAAFDLIEYLPGGALPANPGEIKALIAAAPIPAALMDALPALSIIAAFGAGVDKIDLAHAKSRGIRVANAPDPTVGCVADMAMALLLAAARGIVPGDAFVRAGAWPAGAFPLLPRIHSRRMGIIGLGRIGAAIARRAAGFDMPVAYHNRNPVPGAPYRFVADPVALAAWAEVLVIACPGGEATRHLVNAEVLAALGPTGIVVNIARGSIIDEAALIDALETGGIAGAGLDVFAAEPQVPPRLRAARNAVLMPHRGGGTIETWAETADVVIDAIITHLAGGRPGGTLAGF